MPIPVRPAPRQMTKAALVAALAGLPDTATILFEMPNGEIVGVRSARHGLAPKPLVTILGLDELVPSRLPCLVLKG